jgi:hypothetical protein
VVVDIRVGVGMQPDRGRSSIKYYKELNLFFFKSKAGIRVTCVGRWENCRICAQFGITRLYSQSQQPSMYLPQFSSPSYAARPSAA